MSDAKEKYEEYYDRDPFPSITPSLLNSADIIAYVKKTGMIDPFHETDEDLKPASYSLRLLGEYVYWDEKGTKCEGEIDVGTEFTLPKESIAFVSLEPIIRLPYYIAARFNLKISNVYRGLLLGTGPLVDPGFVGRLSIPLHNLTTNNYKFVGGERLIWMEFTKISPNSIWKNGYENVEESGKYFAFRRSKKNKSLTQFINDADKHREIQSTIPNILSKADKALKTANKVTVINIIGLISVTIALLAIIVTLLFRMIDINENYKSNFDSYQKEVTNMKENSKVLEKKIDSLYYELENNYIRRDEN